MNNYFERVYIGSIRRGRRRNALYEPEFWNVRDRVHFGIPHTTNFVEGWHCCFNASVTCHLLNIWKFLAAVKSEISSTRVVLIQHAIGDNRRVRPNVSAVDTRLKNLAIRAVPDDSVQRLQYIKGIAYSLSGSISD